MVQEHERSFRIIIIGDDSDIHRDIIELISKNDDEATRKKLGLQSGWGKPLTNFLVEGASNLSEGIGKIKLGLQQNHPYLMVFAAIDVPLKKENLVTIQKIWALDSDIQIVICTTDCENINGDEPPEGLTNDNLLVLNRPFNDSSIKMLVDALARKWYLTQDSMQQMDAVSKLEHQATHDPLTNLPNRILLMDRINQSIINADRNNNNFAVLFFDLDRFKLINDSLSHEIGDELLQAVAKRLGISVVRAVDTFARFGGDEFVMVVTSLSKAEDAVNVAYKVLESLKQPFQLKNNTVNLQTSIGIALYPQDAQTAKQLLRHADLAMYYAKERGGSQFRFYRNEFNQQSAEQLSRKDELKRALENNEFYILYQPQFTVGERKFESVEALIRWRHPHKGTILPLDFIPAAEAAGLMVAIGEWVIREACNQHQAWRALGSPHRIALNVSLQQLRQYNFATKLQSILAAHQVSPEFIDIEITESIIVNHKEIAHMVNELKDIGVRVVIDNFGTASSSLNYLKKLRVDGLKIDTSFVNNISHNENDEVIITSIIAMAKRLGITVLAEGVETQTQIDFLQSLNCDGLQGFHFSEPISADLTTTLFKNIDSLN